MLDAAEMNELDEVWSAMLAEAAVNASAVGRHDVADYLRLKATNDAIRAKGVAWLVDSFIDAATSAMRDHASLTVHRDEPHTFRHGNSTMSGLRLTLKKGVRSMTLEAGWTRAPGHGIMRGQAFAVAQVRHFGMLKHAQDLKLIFTDDLPEWLSDDGGDAFTSEKAARHLEILLQ